MFEDPTRDCDRCSYRKEFKRLQRHVEALNYSYSRSLNEALLVYQDAKECDELTDDSNKVDKEKKDTSAEVDAMERTTVCQLPDLK